MSNAPSAQHVALFARSLSGGGGVERVIAHLAAGLSARGHRVDVVLARSKGHFVKELPAAARLIDLQSPPAFAAIPSLLKHPSLLMPLLPAMALPGVAQVLGAIPKLRDYYLEEQPDAILAALDYANITALIARELAAQTKVRVVASVHNHLSSAVQHAERPHLNRIVPLVKNFYPRADKIVCVSDGVADDLAAVASLERPKLQTIYNPVISADFARFAAEPPRHQWLRESRPVILGVGKLRAQKDFATLLRAFARIQVKYDARLIILGEGPDRHALEQLALSLGVAQHVDLAGFDPNPYPYMAHAKLFVLSSAWEGFGNVLVEAMACNTAVVASDCPSGPREILDNGKYGALVPVGDDDAMAAAMAASLRDSKDLYAARERAGEFTIEASAAAYERVLFDRS